MVCVATLSGLHRPVIRFGVNQCEKCGEALGDPKVLARATDAATSHMAAQSIISSGRQNTLKAKVLKALLKNDGMTSGEIADSLGLAHEQIWRRVSDLKNDGVIRPDGMRMWRGSGKMQEVWWLV